STGPRGRRDGGHRPRPRRARGPRRRRARARRPPGARRARLAHPAAARSHRARVLPGLLVPTGGPAPRRPAGHGEDPHPRRDDPPARPTGGALMITTDRPLAGPYALDAIDGDEQAAYEAHLDDCATCVLEVAEFHETAALLAQGVAQPVPAGLLD